MTKLQQTGSPISFPPESDAFAPMRHLLGIAGLAAWEIFIFLLEEAQAMGRCSIRNRANMRIMLMALTVINAVSK